MRLPLLAAALLLLPALAKAPAQTAAAPEVKLLTVGNSFADNALFYLPEFAKAGGKKLTFFRANLPGHSLEQHASYLAAAEADPSSALGHAYKAERNPFTGEKKDYSLPEALALGKWDYVTIQQYSALSYKPETFEPYAGQIVAAIRKYAPGAEILVHETWAYRQDSPLFAKGDLTQQAMYDGLKADYEQLAARYGGLRIIPSGDAFQLARATPRWHFSFPDPKFDYAHAVPPALPDQTGSLNMGWAWADDKNTGSKVLRLDPNHSNFEGRYLIAAAWYETLFKESVENVPFVPKELTAEDAAALRRLAHQAVATRAAVPLARASQ